MPKTIILALFLISSATFYGQYCINRTLLDYYHQFGDLESTMRAKTEIDSFFSERFHVTFAGFLGFMNGADVNQLLSHQGYFLAFIHDSSSHFQSTPMVTKFNLFHYRADSLLQTFSCTSSRLNDAQLEYCRTHFSIEDSVVVKDISIQHHENNVLTVPGPIYYIIQVPYFNFIPELPEVKMLSTTLQRSEALTSLLKEYPHDPLVGKYCEFSTSLAQDSTYFSYNYRFRAGGVIERYLSFRITMDNLEMTVTNLGTGEIVSLEKWERKMKKN